MNEFEPHNLATDPHLDALLDEALAPGDVPAGLNDRILAATQDRLASPTTPEHETPAVIGRIGGGLPWRSIAAVMLFALVLGGVWVANQTGSQTSSTPEDSVAIENTPDLEAVWDQLAATEGRVEWADPIDDRIDLLSMQLVMAETTDVWSRDALESLDTAIDHDGFDSLADEMDLYF